MTTKYNYDREPRIKCHYCNVKLKKADATKIDLLFIGKRSKRIVHNIKYFHPIHYNRMIASLSRDVKEHQTSDLDFEAEKFKIFGTHLTRLDRKRFALGELVFHKLLKTLNTGLEDALYREASVKINIKPARGYYLYNKWMTKKKNR
ncbi:MAG: hypothetical protein Q8O30_06200 [Candidatus Omnitrophota bacterium]|nr:hypothetical protein [Candidatus Omnitrophota bacterium]